MDLHWIFQRMDTFSEKTCLIHKNIKYSYSELKNEVLLWLDFFSRHKIKHGESVAFASDYSVKTSSLIIALLINKNIAVPLRTNKDDIIKQYLGNAYAQHFIIFREDMEYNYNQINIKESHHMIENLKQSEKAGLILFTSGSTGEPKAVLHNFDKLIGKYQKKRTAYRIMIFLFIDHIGGINTLFRILCSGGTIIISHDRAPEAVCRLIEKYKVEMIPATPSFLRMLLMSGASERFDLSTLKTISYGTEPMNGFLLEKLVQTFPSVNFKQTYGLSELGIFGIQSERSDSLYIKFNKNIKTKIVNDELWIKSNEAMLCYLNAPNPFDSNGWFNTQDRVEVKDNCIKIKGRTNDTIIVGGEKVHPTEVEDVLLGIENVEDTLVYGKKSPILGNIVGVKVKLIKKEPLETFEKRLIKFCKKRLEPYKIPAVVELVDTIAYSERMKKIRR